MELQFMTPTGPKRPNARRSQAYRLAARTGMSYADALQQVMRADEPWQPVHRWVLTDDVRSWLSGESRRGGGHDDLYAWFDTAVSPTYKCDECGEPGDARTTDSSISLLVTAYDPDIAPFTRHLATRKYHATCQPSSITWTQAAEIPPGPQRLRLPHSAEPALVGEFDLEAHALLDTDPEDGKEHAMLLLTAHVVQDHGRGFLAWLTELELYLGGEGLGRVHELAADAETGWLLRIADEHAGDTRPPWIAIRTGHGDNDDGTPHHLLLCSLNLPHGWTVAARRAGYVEVAIGPCTRHWDYTPVPEALADRITELVEHHTSTGSTAERCGCSILTVDDAVELVDSNAFLVGSVRVLRDNELR